MPIQIPTLERFNPQSEGSVGRLDYKPVDVSKGQEIQTQAADKLAGTVEHYVQKEQEYVADTTANAAAVKYHQYLENALEGPNGAKRQKGDPAPVYQKFDEDARGKYTEILDSYKDASDLTKAHITAKLNDTSAKFYDRKTTAFGNQSNIYETEVTKDSIKITKDEMLDATAHLDVNDPNTLIPLETKLAKAQDLSIKSGLKQGTVKPILDPSGEIDPITKQVKVIGYNLDPSVKMQIAKDKSEGLTGAIENLIASGDVEGAKFLTEKYKQDLDRVNRPKIEEKTLKAAIEQEGIDEFDKVRNLPSATAMQRLNQIDDPKVREKAMAELDTYQRRMENSTKRSSRETYSAVGRYILEKQKNGNAFVDVNEMENDPVVKRLLGTDNIKDPKQLEALRHMVTQPKESDPDAKNEAYRVMFNGGLKGMAPEEFNQLISGLNKEDRNKIESKWQRFNTQTSSEENRMTKNMGSQLTKELQTLGYVKKNEFGKYNNKDQIKLNLANDELINAMDDMPPGLTQKEQNLWVQKFAADKVKGEVFKPPEFEVSKKFLGKPENAKNTPKPDVSETPGVVDKTDLATKTKASQEFKKKYGVWPDLQTQELQNFMKTGNK